MSKIAIVYGSSTDNTKDVAEMIAGKFAGNDVTLLDVSNLKTGVLDDYPNLILGTSTWGLGDLQDDWDGYLADLKGSNLSGKTIAFFGLGDSGSYPDTFVDGMGILYETVQGKGANIVGTISPDGYSYNASRAEVDGQFVGLPLDEDNESDKTEDRVAAWVEQIKSSFV